MAYRKADPQRALGELHHDGDHCIGQWPTEDKSIDALEMSGQALRIIALEPPTGLCCIEPDTATIVITSILDKEMLNAVVIKPPRR